MMKHNDKKIEEKVEKALDYYGQERYQPNPFLYTRIQEQVRNEEATVNTWVWKPVLAATLILLNAVVVFQTFNSGNTDLSDQISSAYQIDGENESMYYYDFSNE